jgi:peptidyl-prolyl cis-trans isomerase B (cyclophilin B)
MLARKSLILVAALGLFALVSCKSIGEEQGGAMTMETVTIVITTSKGDFEVELWGEKAPKTVANFLSYVDDGFFTNTIFHRVMPGFMIQGGGFTADMSQKSTRGNVENEADNGVANGRGTIAMARTSDPHSATAQFFINLVDNRFLNHTEKSTRGWGYCAFGTVTAGMDVVDAIAAVPTSNHGGHQNVPSSPVTIEGVRRK